ncbi:hypothetical protein CSC79_08065 [Pseudoalteromonas sp. 3D05]|nr:hypothetical protein CSC79_08065 [Pseudoalteromonas sp. 3D05]
MILTIEPLLLAINALPISLLIPTETRILRWFGYKGYFCCTVAATQQSVARFNLGIASLRSLSTAF